MQSDRPIGPPALHATVKLGDASLLASPRPPAQDFDAHGGVEAQYKLRLLIFTI